MQTLSQEKRQAKDKTSSDKKRQQENIEEKILDKKERIRALELKSAQKEKEIKHIQKSKTWKNFSWLHSFMKKIPGIFGRRKRTYIKTLEEKLEKISEEHTKAKAELRNIYLNDSTLNQYEIIDFLRHVRDQGELIEYLNQIIEKKKANDENYQGALKYIARLFMDEDHRIKEVIYKKILSSLKIEDMPEFIVREGLTEEAPLPLKEVSSFRANLSMRLRKKQLSKDLPEFILEDKRDAYYFVDMLNLKRPEIYAQRISYKNLPKYEQAVVKPMNEAGARGVYLIRDSHDIIDIHRSKTIKHWDKFTSSMSKDLKEGLVQQDEWLMEELVLEDKKKKALARDLKFYCFYGKVGLILEITRYPERKHCWWTKDRKRTRTGKYEEDLFSGQGVSEEDIRLVEELSAKIPAPFIRIDFLRSEGGLVFGEFTAKPGNYDEFDRDTDQRLGDLYLEAEERLTNDLLNGEKFQEFMRFKDYLGYEMKGT